MQHQLFQPKLELYHYDCVERLARLTCEFQTIFIDPPYATGNKAAKYERSRLLKEKHWTNFAADWDVWASQDHYAGDVERWCEALRSKMDRDGALWVCGSHHSIPTWDITLKRLGLWVNQWVQWCIPNAMPNVAMTQMASSNQTIIYARRSKAARHYYNAAAARSYNNGKNLRDYWLIPNDCVTGKTYKHPSKKPVTLVQRALHISTPPDGLVLDCFAGSGTTGVAARNLELPCVLVERDAKYIPMIEDRLAISRSEAS